MDKLAKVIKNDGDFKGSLLIIVGVAVALSPYIAALHGALIPDSLTWFIVLTGKFQMASGIGLTIGYIFTVLGKARGYQCVQHQLPAPCVTHAPDKEPDKAKQTQSPVQDE